MRGDKQLYKILENIGVTFDYYEHPAVATVEEAAKYWEDLDATHCKNIFLRNHKGNKHYLVIIEHKKNLKITFKIAIFRFIFLSIYRICLRTHPCTLNIYLHRSHHRRCLLHYLCLFR